jgi:hypothetical protein
MKIKDKEEEITTEGLITMIKKGITTIENPIKSKQIKDKTLSMMVKDLIATTKRTVNRNTRDPIVTSVTMSKTLKEEIGQVAIKISRISNIMVNT